MAKDFGGLLGIRAVNPQTPPAVAAHNGQSGLPEPDSPLARANASKPPHHAMAITPNWIWFHTEKPPHFCTRGTS